MSNLFDQRFNPRRIPVDLLFSFFCLHQETSRDNLERIIPNTSSLLHRFSPERSLAKWRTQGAFQTSNVERESRAQRERKQEAFHFHSW